MTNFYYHIVWFVFFLLFTVIFLSLSLWLSFIDVSFSLFVNLFSLSFIDVSFSLFIDSISSWFSTCILFISSVVFIFSFSYISPSNNTLPFLWLTTLFVLSMLLVVNCSDLFFTMLGWDGLGLISFFLIVFYQNQSSITSGLFTLFINRLGDSFFIFSLVLMSFCYPSFNLFSYSLCSFALVVFLLLSFSTNSAIFPFSSWLPAAMAAPTPISALVHSSTLVASGLFLMMRYSYLFYLFPNIVSVMLVFTVFTSFYAGINSLFEVDMNKLIALSTLSHLGFIGLAFSSGLVMLAFLHMLVHALFNSLLFICIGDIIHCSSHSQDIRHLGAGFNLTPFSCQIMHLCLANLLGLPMLSGFFSNDLVLEMLGYSNLSYFITLMIYLNVFFTYFYTYKIFLYSVNTSSFSSFNMVHSTSNLHLSLLTLLSFITLFSTHFFIGIIFNSTLFVPIPFYINFLPIFINVVLFWFIFINNGLFLFDNNCIFTYFSSIMFLTNTVSSVSSYLFFIVSTDSLNSSEDGLFYALLNSQPYFISYFISSNFLFISSNFLFISICFTSVFILLLFLF